MESAGGAVETANTGPGTLECATEAGVTYLVRLLDGCSGQCPLKPPGDRSSGENQGIEAGKEHPLPCYPATGREVCTTARTSVCRCRSTPGFAEPPPSSPQTTATSLPSTA